MGQAVSSWRLVGGLGAAFAAMLVAVTAGGEARMLGLVGLQAGPLLVLCGLAQLGQRHPGLRAVSWTWFGLVLAVLAFVSLGLVAAASGEDGSLALLGLLGVLVLALAAASVAVLT